MSQQSPKLVSDTHYCLVGDVSVDATAAIAPGVVLQAGSGSRIIIGQNACLAAGVCVQSRKGVLTIAAGVSLGANVLVVGSGEIGANACISAGTTLIDPSVDADGIVPPDSLVDRSAGGVQHNRSQVNGSQSGIFQSRGFQRNGFQSNGFQSNGFQPSSHQNSSYQNGGYQSGIPQSYSTFQAHDSSTSDDVQSTYIPSQNTPSQNIPSQNTANSSSSQIAVRSSYDRVYGREQVSKLISALFPDRQPPNG